MVDNKPSNMSSQPIREGSTDNQDQHQGASQQGISSSGVHSNFASASPESNVNPPGAPQTSHGSVTGAVPGGKDADSTTTAPQLQSDKPSM